MTNDLAAVKEIFVTKAPASIDLDVYQGRQGARGTWVIPGLGHPSNYYNIVEQKYIYTDPTGALPRLVAQFYDWYLDLDTSSETYLTTFQLKETGQWEKIFKVIPNVFNTNRVLTFSSGITSTVIEVSDQTLLLEQQFGDNFNLSELSVNLDLDLESIAPDLPYPIIKSFTIGAPTYVDGTYAFPIDIIAYQVHPVNGLEPIDGNKIAHVSISVI